jgi:hypothetical protein
MIPGMGAVLRDGSSSQSTGCAESDPDRGLGGGPNVLRSEGRAPSRKKRKLRTHPRFLTAAVAYMIAGSERAHMAKLANSTIERLTLHTK